MTRFCEPTTTGAFVSVTQVALFNPALFCCTANETDCVGQDSRLSTTTTYLHVRQERFQHVSSALDLIDFSRAKQSA